VSEAFTWRDGARDPGPAVVVDIDGVLADAAARQHHLEQRPKDWRAFFDAAGGDELIEPIAALVDLLDPAIVVVLLSARPARLRDLTVDWLTRHGVRWDLLVLRDDGDFRSSPEAKRDAVVALVRSGFDVRVAIDDDTRNVAMFEAEGVPCLYVHSGYYET
jgi:hypothetical protein